MNRSLFLFVVLCVTACSVKFGGDGGGGPWGGGPGADPSPPWAEPVVPPDASADEPWSDGGPTEPWSDGSVDPSVDGGAVEPADASLPPCHAPDPDAG